MQKQYRLRKRRDFSYVYRRGKSTPCRSLVVFVIGKSGQKKQVGFSVNKKFGNAVERNTVKRRLREALRPMLPDLLPGMYIVLIRPAAAKLDYHALNRDLRYVLHKAGRLKQ